MKKIILSFLTLIICSASVWSQIEFTESDIVHKGNRYYSGVAIAATDINGDFLDDVIHMDQGRDLYVRYQTSAGVFDHVVFVGRVSNSSQWSMAVADVDNDGWCEILIAGAWDGVKIYKSDKASLEFTRTLLPFNDFLAQCSNLADINNDGFLDAFICDDNAANHIGINDGNGHFIEMDSLIDFQSNPPTDQSGNYGSNWTDFDLDGDLDLFIAKCRQGVDDPADPRRINMLMVNDGQNHFTNMADSFGLASGEQSWAADFGDIDNDGDWDAMVANHYADAELLINDGEQHFSDEAVSRGLTISGFPIQSLFRDFNNDGFLDILIVGTHHFLFVNNGDGTFQEIPDPFGVIDIESIAIGDLNGDMFLDVYAGYADIFTSPSNDPDRVWINSGNDNHAVRIKLLGIQSNRDGVGARLELYSPMGKQMREVRAGESYGISNSLVQHFGLGQDVRVDSVVVFWPSGGRERYIVGINDTYLLQEGSGCVTSAEQVYSENGTFLLCEGDSLLLYGTPDPGAEPFNWSTGDTSQSIYVHEEGLYQYNYKDASGCVVLSSPSFVSYNPDQTPQLTIEGDLVFCEGATARLIASSSPNYTWNTGDTTSEISVNQEGSYFVSVEGACAEHFSDTVHIEVLAAEPPVAINDTIVDEGEAVLVAMGENILWYDQSDALVPVADTDTLLLGVIDSTQTYYVENAVMYTGAHYQGGESGHRGPTLYNGPNVNGGLLFDVKENIQLESISVGTEFAGQRAILVQNDISGYFWSDTFMIDSGFTVLPLSLDLPIGENYYITTHTDLNVSEFGSENPRLFRNEAATAYPYFVGDDIEIKASNFGTDYYYYFYDWKIREEDRICVSERLPVQAVVIMDVATNDVYDFPLVIYPNPFTDELMLKAEEPVDRIRITDFGGKVIWEHTKNGKYHWEINADLMPGMYIMECFSGRQLSRHKIVRQ